METAQESPLIVILTDGTQELPKALSEVPPTEIENETPVLQTSNGTVSSTRLKVVNAAQYKILDPKLRSTLTLPVGHVPKGRPKGKERPTAIGRKRKGVYYSSCLILG